jgi:hypothetical protein
LGFIIHRCPPGFFEKEDLVTKTTSRRNLIKAAAVGSVAAGLGLKSHAATRAEGAAQNPNDHEHHLGPVDGPYASATVSFGAFPADPDNIMDRSPNRSPNNRNVHLLIPHEVTIKEGGTVNFLITGFHWLAIYDDGTLPSDITVDYVNASGFLIDDPNRRIYRGLNPGSLNLLTPDQPNLVAPFAPVVLQAIPANPGATPPTTGTLAQYLLGVRDRTEVVAFPKRGRYLAICLVRPHFSPAPGQFDMFGHIKVIP